jgi:hypothetical protein
MIQLDKDGVTLFYIDANGNRIAHYYTEGQAYSDMLTIRGAQIQAISENDQAVANYNNVLANVQISVTAGRGDTVTAPAKPLQKVVADADGAVTYVPFVPPLADIVPLVSVPSGSIAAPSLDKQTIMYNAIQMMLPKIVALYQKEFPNG